jgi:hypothetical protein
VKHLKKTIKSPLAESNTYNDICITTKEVAMIIDTNELHELIKVNKALGKDTEKFETALLTVEKVWERIKEPEPVEVSNG